MAIKIQTNYAVEKVSKPISFKHCERITKQADKEACDINNIVAKYRKTGQLPELIAREPKYGDFSSGLDFRGAMDIIKKAEEQFMCLDVKTRKRFNNNPAEFLDFVEDPKNVGEMVKMGLAVEIPKPSTSDPVEAPKETGAAGSSSAV